ncbi:hypothetical protein [Magnetospirillum sulfuroxidans]|uniref:Lipoprotein n=1 Tax=Magnetospirillum sulfuroxidans TaxID=611300 RepID=A0ABS5IEF1_9PROT|nr:hypothetical protein [Magnetospirillum sulfuroxidans]MBR9972801.1 hypothetical protein [Magnetospirillum sulfuroxidans]
MLWRNVVISAGICTLSACVHGGGAMQPIASRPMDSAQAVQSLSFPWKGAVAALSTQVFAHEGRVALCGYYKLFAAEDRTAEIRAAMATPGSVVTVTTMQSRKVLKFDAKFIDVVFQPIEIDKGAKLIGGSDGKPAKCVVSEQAWSSEFAAPLIGLQLLIRDPRQRAQSVVK